jgi:hypothetical protein
MSDKAEQVLKNLKRKDRKGLKRWSALQSNPKRRDQILENLNYDQLDHVSPVAGGGDQEMRVLKEMNELQEFENDIGAGGAYDYPARVQQRDRQA